MTTGVSGRKRRYEEHAALAHRHHAVASRQRGHAQQHGLSLPGRKETVSGVSSNSLPEMSAYYKSALSRKVDDVGGAG